MLQSVHDLAIILCAKSKQGHRMSTTQPYQLKLHVSGFLLDNLHCFTQDSALIVTGHGWLSFLLKHNSGWCAGPSNLDTFISLEVSNVSVKLLRNFRAKRALQWKYNQQKVKKVVV